MTSTTQKNSTYFFSQYVLNITPHTGDDGKPSIIKVACSQNAQLAYLDTGLWDVTSEWYSGEGQLSGLTQEQTQRAASTLDAAFGYIALEPRKFNLVGYDTKLANPDVEHTIYIRLDPLTKDALVMFVPSDSPVDLLQFRKVPAKDADGNYIQQPTITIDTDDGQIEVIDQSQQVNLYQYDYSTIEYIYINIGTVSAITGNARTVEFDSGWLGTTAQQNEQTESKWYTLDQNEKSVSMNDNGNTTWSFLHFVTKHIKMPLFGSQDDWYDSNVSMATSQSEDVDTVESEAKDSVLNTVGYLFGPFLTWLRSKFVRKDNPDETEEMEGSLKSKKDITAEGKTTTNTFESKSDATFGGDITATDGTTTANDITTSDKDNTHNETITGHGTAVYEDADHSGHVVTDYLAVRKAAWFRSVTIEEVKHVGGEMILSQAACQIGRVLPGYGVAPDGSVIPPPGNDYTITPKFYRCYFPTEANGKKQYNEWAVGDQARCQVCNLAAGTSENVVTKYYWRLVERIHVATGDETEHWIDLSNTDYDGASGSTKGNSATLAQDYVSVPEGDDSVVLLGHRNPDSDGLYSRTSAQVYSTAETNSPSRRYYHGITSYDLNGKDVETMEWDATANHPHWRVGRTDEYIDFSKDGLKIVTKNIFASSTGKTMEETMAELAEQSKQEALDAVDGMLTEGINVHAQTPDEAVKSTYPTPNDYSPLGDGNTPYMSAEMDEYTSSLTLEDEIGNYFVTTKGLVFCLVAVDGEIYWHNVTDKYLVDASNKADAATNTANDASSKADDATTTANEALSAAEQARKDVEANGKSIADYTQNFNKEFSELKNWKATATENIQRLQQAGFLTTAEAAEIFAKDEVTWTDADGVEHTDTIAASIKASVEDGVSHARIAADQIDLRGETTISGILRNGYVILNEDEDSTEYFGKAIKLQTHNPFVNAWYQNGNPWPVGYRSFNVLDIARIGNLTYIPALGSLTYPNNPNDDHINLVLPSYDPNGCYPGTHDPGLATNSWMGGDSIIEGMIVELWKVYKGNSNLTTIGQWNADADFKDNIESLKNHILYMARQYVGAEITIITKMPLRIFGGWKYDGDELVDGQGVSYEDKEGGNDGDYHTNWLNPIDVQPNRHDESQDTKVVNLRCVHTNSLRYTTAESMGAVSGDCVYWEVRISGYNDYDNKFLYGNKQYDYNKAINK